MMAYSHYIRFFREIGIGDVALVGGKNASLGEMYRALSSQGVRVPNGFAVTAEAYRDLLTAADAWGKLHELLDHIDASKLEVMSQVAEKAREIVYQAGLPVNLQSEILVAYRELQREYGDSLTVAVRSSATAEDLPTASFAGQHETFLNIRSETHLLEACRQCFASLFTERAIHYRIDQGFDHFKVALSIGIMKMVRSDLAASGVIFSIDTESGFKDVVLISASYGLGENVVQGNVNTDEFYVHKPTFLLGKKAVLRHMLGGKSFTMVYDDTLAKATTRNIDTPVEKRSQFCISDAEVLELADCAIKIEKHYSDLAGHHVPMDMEWAKDGVDGKLYIVQARPETVTSQRQGNQLQQYVLKSGGTVLTTGRAVGERIAYGRAHIVTRFEQLEDFKPGEVLVAETTAPDWEPIMKTAAAIVTNRGGRTCHAAIVARELGIPAVVGANEATRNIPDGSIVTVCCAEGDTGKVYSGSVPFEVLNTDLSRLGHPTTNIMINLGNPELAFKYSFLPNDGVGLARMEFIISEYIRAHPMALLHPDKIADAEDRKKIRNLIANYRDGSEYFVQQLSEGIGTIAAAFYPKPVVVRLSDFKSNEYAALLGGKAFEPSEVNPMLGFRGASRYAHPAYEEGFAMECAALKRVREDMGFDNVIVMAPFVRRLEEADRVLAKMESCGLKRGALGLQVYAMCEIPNNVIQIDAFAKRFDGFSIGSNDLTQLVLGVDRDSDLVAFDYDERDPGVKQMIRLAVEGCRRNGIHSGLCGQAPSDYPEMAEFLVRLGIESISLNPDSVLKTTRLVLDIEAGMQAEAKLKMVVG